MTAVSSKQNSRIQNFQAQPLADELNEIVFKTVALLAAGNVQEAAAFLRATSQEATRQRASPGTLHTLTVLEQLVALQRRYSSLAFARKRNRPRAYGGTENNRIRDLVAAARETLPSQSEGDGSLITDQALAGVSLYTKAVNLAMDLYLNLANNQSKSQQVLLDVMQGSRDTVRLLKSMAKGPLDRLMLVLRQDMEGLHQLVVSHVSIENYSFLDSTLALDRAKASLDQWELVLSPTGQTTNSVYIWQREYQAILLAKYTLYFYSLLAALPSPPASTHERSPAFSLVRSIKKFCRNNTTATVSLLFNALKTPYYKGGYALPGTHTPPDGLASFPVIFSWPKALTHKQLINVVVTTMEQWHNLAGLGHVEYLLDDIGTPSTHYVACVGENVCLSLCLAGKRGPRDQQAWAFLKDVIGRLQRANTIANLLVVGDAHSSTVH